jgi:hypothetical protein
MSSKVNPRFQAKVKNGVVPLPAKLKLADGSPVELIPLVPLPDDPPFLKTALKLSKPRNWPRDFALNHGHYIKGQAKK